MPVGLLSEEDRRPVRNNVRSLQQAPRIEIARFPVRSQALSLRVILIGIQQHEEIFGERFVGVIFIAEFVNRRIAVVKVDAF